MQLRHTTKSASPQIHKSFVSLFGKKQISGPPPLYPSHLRFYRVTSLSFLQSVSPNTRGNHPPLCNLTCSDSVFLFSLHLFRLFICLTYPPSPNCIFVPFFTRTKFWKKNKGPKTGKQKKKNKKQNQNKHENLLSTKKNKTPHSCKKSTLLLW